MPAIASPATGIGARVRALRDASGLSLRDLAARSGVSAPMLSQVERGDTSPTLAVAAKIAGGLSLSLSQLLRLDEEPPMVVVRKGERRITRSPRHRIEECTPGLPGERASVTIHALKAGGSTGRGPLHAAGSRETIVVQSGTISFDLQGSTVELHQGDAVTFDADLPHRFENPGRSDATFFAVVTAGLRGS